MSDPIRSSSMPLPSLGFPVRVLEAGSGPPVLLLHGNPDSADEWRDVMRLLADTHHCIAPDFPGYGQSAAPPAAFAYDRAAQVAWADAVLTATGVTGPVTVVVHDIGGFVGSPWADANLDRLRGMVFTNTVAFEGFRWFSTARAWGRTDPRGQRLARFQMWVLGRFGGALFRRAFGQQSPNLSPELLDRMTAGFATNPAAKDATLRQFRHATRRGFFDGYDAMNARIIAAVPTRVVWGLGDVYIPDRWSDAFAPAPTRKLEGVGHWVPLLRPDAVAEAVRDVSPVGTRPTGGT